MGVDVSVVENQETLQVLNKNLNEFKQTVQQTFQVTTSNVQNTTNEIVLQFNDVQAGNIDFTQTAYQENLIDIVNICSSAIKQTTNDEQKAEVKQQIQKEAEKQVGLFSAQVSVSKNKSDTKIANEISNKFLTELKTEMKNDFKNLQEVKNSIKIQAARSKIGDITLNQDADQRNSTKASTKSDTTVDAAAATAQSPKTEQGIKEMAKVTTGLSEAMFKNLMIAIVIIAVVGVVFGLKAAVDPNLAGNIKAVGDAKKMVGGGLGDEFVQYLLKLLPAVFIIFAIVLIILLIYYYIIKPYTVYQITNRM